MAVTVNQLALALRLTADSTTDPDAAITEVLTRQLGVADAYVEVFAPTAPEAIKDEATIRFAGYLYDSPSSPAGNRYTAIFQNSGASALLSPWILRRAATPSSTDTSDIPAEGGLNQSQVQALIDAAVAGFSSGLNQAQVQVLIDQAVAGIMSGGLNQAEILELIAPFAQAGNTANLPNSKISNEAITLSRIANAVVARLLPIIDNSDAVGYILALVAGAGDTLVPDWIEDPAGEGGGLTADQIMRLLPTTVGSAVGNVLSISDGPGNALVPSWTATANPGFFLSGEGEPAENLAQSGGHYLRVPDDGPEEMWVRYAGHLPWVKIATFQKSLIRVDTGAALPSAEDNQHRIALQGNRLFASQDIVTIQGHGRIVNFLDLSVGGNTISGTHYAQHYAGNFADPPQAANYILEAFIWDRGSQLWLLNQNDGQGGRRWVGYSGPTGIVHGDYFDDEAAESHVNAVGQIVVTGTGSSQKPRIVSAYTAPVATHTEWQWIGIGLTSQDVEDIANSRIAIHNESATSHLDVRNLIVGNTNLISALQSASGLTIMPYLATATYSKGSSNSFITHGTGLYVYVSGTERSSGHDPGQHPEYWFRLDHGCAVRVFGVGAERFAEGTIIITTSDEVFICTTDITTPRGLDYIRLNSGVGGEFLQLAGGVAAGVAAWALTANPDTLVPLNKQEAYRDFAIAGSGTDWKEGQLARYDGKWWIINVDHQQSIGDLPPTNDDFDRLALHSEITAVGFAPTLLGTINISVTSGNDDEFISTGINIPNSATWFWLNVGAAVSGKPANANYAMVLASHWRSLTAGTVGESADENDSLFVDGLTALGLNQVRIGRSSSNELFIWINVDTIDPMPLTVYGI